MSSKLIEKLKELVKEAPIVPGVYLMKSKTGKILYIGKAKNIRARVRTYFNDSKDHSAKTRLLVSFIEDVEFLTTKTEAEAFLLEASLIKKHRPKYNIRLKDDKSYPYLRISTKDVFPRLYLARSVRNSDGYYYGPFTSGSAVRETIQFLNQTFLIRDCSDGFMKIRKRPCMTHQIGRCTAPCVDLITPEEYAKSIKSVIQFLNGRNKKLLKELNESMKQAAAEERFEAAGKFRDSMWALEHILEKQSVINAQEEKDQDVLSFYGESTGTTIECLHIRKGVMIGHQFHHFPLVDISADEQDIRDTITSFVMQYYEENLIPDEILMPVEMGRDLTILMEKLLAERKGEKVHVRFPTDEKGRDLLTMARQNAQESFKAQMRKQNEKDKGLKEIQKKFELEGLPLRIECYDISNLQGQHVVASQVVFENGLPSKDHYRRYKIRTVDGQDDFASMKEVLSRRLKHTEYDDPDLIVIDGGKGQLKMALEALKDCGRPDIPIVSLAKARTKADFTSENLDSSVERFFIPGRSNPIVLLPNSPALHILTGIRDEAHRFAITYHRKLRESATISSILDEITGLGEKRKKILLTRFTSIEEIAAANAEEIASLPTFNLVLAKRVLLHLEK